MKQMGLEKFITNSSNVCTMLSSLLFLFLSAQEWTLEVRMEIYHLSLHHSGGRNHENPGILLLCDVTDRLTFLNTKTFLLLFTELVANYRFKCCAHNRDKLNIQSPAGSLL